MCVTLGSIAALFIPVRDGRTRARVTTETSSNTFRSFGQVAGVAEVVEDVLEVGEEVGGAQFQGGVE